MLSNEEVLGRMRKEKEILNTIKIRKLEYLSHVMRRAKYVAEYYAKKEAEKEDKWLNNLRKRYNCSSIELFRAAASTSKIAMMIANILRRWHLKKKKLHVIILFRYEIFN